LLEEEDCVNVTILAKYVPNPSGDPPEIGPDFRLRREGPEGGLDPADEPSVEIGRRLAAEAGGEVTVVSMGPEPAIRAVRRALALGAHKAVLITDDSLRGADTLATARVLAAAIKRQPYDLVIGGVESSDGYTGTLPMTLAEFLGVPCVTFARQVVLKTGSVSIQRQTASGYDVVECALPSLVTVTAGVAEVHVPSFKEISKARQKPIELLSLGDLGLRPDDVRPTQEVTAIEFGQEKQAGEVIDDEAQAPARIMQFLQEAKVL
jgi:electron transfer flavoprotein beta subunit